MAIPAAAPIPATAIVIYGYEITLICTQQTDLLASGTLYRR